MRPLEIVILNLMPDKVATETQLLRLIGNTAIQVHITLIHPKSHESKNTPKKHLISFYKHFDKIKKRKFDGLIITGAPVEMLDFEEVDYWEELKEIMEWSKHNVTSTFYICWGAQAGLYYHYGIKKYPLKKKMFGVFPHTINKKHVKLLRGFDDTFFVPHSRYTEIRREDVLKVKSLEILSESKESGVYLVADKERDQFFIMGHSEYDSDTLRKEFERDMAKGMKIDFPKNYFPENNPKNEPIVSWRGHSNLLFCNWLNYYVYQETPFELEKIK